MNRLFSHGKAPAEQQGESALDVLVREHNMNIIEEVESALRNRRVLLAFQPAVHGKDMDRPAFWEALIRLRDSQGRVLPAGDFMPAVEAHETGRAIDCLALELGLAELNAFPHIRLAINMSALSINYPRWHQVLERGLAVNPTIGERLILEITESSVIASPERMKAFMSAQHAKGISFALDDFGAGYTSLRYLKEFTFDIMKIDGSFVSGIDRDGDNQILVEALLGMARKFDMVCVAEKVERETEAKVLSAMGMDCMQGYYFSAPTFHPTWRSEPIKRQIA